jgi:hypothetical protein
MTWIEIQNILFLIFPYCYIDLISSYTEKLFLVSFKFDLIPFDLSAD